MPDTVAADIVTATVRNAAFTAYPLHFETSGQFVPVYPALPRGVEVMTLMEAFVSGEENHLLGKYIDLNQYLCALDTAYLEEGLFIRVGRGVRLSRPLALHFPYRRRHALPAGKRSPT